MLYQALPWLVGQNGGREPVRGLHAKISFVLIYLARLYCC